MRTEDIIFLWLVGINLYVLLGFALARVPAKVLKPNTEYERNAWTGFTFFLWPVAAVCIVIVYFLLAVFAVAEWMIHPIDAVAKLGGWIERKSE